MPNNECQTPMIHRYRKQQNILFYKYLKTHLGDFDLVKLVHEFNNE